MTTTENELSIDERIEFATMKAAYWTDIRGKLLELKAARTAGEKQAIRAEIQILRQSMEPQAEQFKYVPVDTTTQVIETLEEDDGTITDPQPV